MQLLAQPPTPSTIREALFADPKKPTDPELLVLILGSGSRLQGAGKKVRRSWNAYELAQALLEAAGGRLTHLIASLHENTFDLKPFGIGPTLGSRLIAALELAHRFAQGMSRGGNGKIRGERRLAKRVFQRNRRATEAELIAVLLDQDLPGGEDTTRLLAAYDSPAHLIETLTRADFEAAYEKPFRDLRHSASGVELKTVQCSRLLAAVEIAHRHRKRKRGELKHLEPAALGFSSPDLLRLLDRSSPLDAELRKSLLETLRTHPEHASDFANLERLTREALTDDYKNAIELQSMWETLIKRRKWNHPAEILGDPVPYPALLSIAQARIDAGAGPQARIRRIQQLLERAELEATREPVAAFVEVLLDLGLSEPGVKKTFEEVRSRYFESRRRRQEAPP